MPLHGWRAWIGANYWIAAGRKWPNVPTFCSLVPDSILREAWSGRRASVQVSFSSHLSLSRPFWNCFVNDFRNRPSRYRQADKICRHQFDLLGYEDLAYGDPIDWHLDPVHGKQAPRGFFTRSVISTSTRLEIPKSRGN